MTTVALTSLPLERKVSLLTGGSMWASQEVSEAGLPALVLTDGPHGVRKAQPGRERAGFTHSEPATCFPPAVAVGNSWDVEAAAQVGQALGREARALGVAVLLGPGINLKRSPLCGRNFEYYSEDPLLAGALGAAHVEGLQSQGVGASVKHFAANNQETERMRISAEVDPRTLRELYLPAFERVVRQARPATVMCAYNRVNGVPASQHRWLLTEVLRDEWGYEGAVISDWGAVSDRVASLAAGLDLAMPGPVPAFDAALARAVHDRVLDESVVDRSVERVAALARLGGGAAPEVDHAAHHELARRVAQGCAVLLKNDDATLPLPPAARLLVVGEQAAEPRYQGGGSSYITATRTDAALDAMRRYADERGQALHHEPGHDVEAAVRAAEAADVAVVFAGLSEQQESEGFDRTELVLPDAQVELIRAVAAAAARTVVVLSHGGVVTLEGWHDEVDAVLDGFLLGQAGGQALADLLFGEANPSGHLAESIPLRLEDTPSHLNFPGEQGVVRYGEGVLVGYRYYETVQRPVRYPFGHGLSYTTFSTSDLSVTATGPDSALVRVTVANTGARAGGHVVQVYVGTEAGPVRRPRRELRAFSKVLLAPGESRQVELELDRRAFAYWDVHHDGWVVAPGEYRVEVGESAAVVVASAPLQLDGDGLGDEVTLDSSLGEWLAHPELGPALLARLSSAFGSGVSDEERLGQLQMVASMPLRQLVGLAPDASLDVAAEELLAGRRR